MRLRSDSSWHMSAPIKDLLKIEGVHGYAVADAKSTQIKLPSRHPLAGGKNFFTDLRRQLVEESDRPGNLIEIYLDDMVLTSFINRSTMLTAVSSRRANLALVRMTGKLVSAALSRDK